MNKRLFLSETSQGPIWVGLEAMVVSRDKGDIVKRLADPGKEQQL